MTYELLKKKTLKEGVEKPQLSYRINLMIANKTSSVRNT